MLSGEGGPLQRMSLYRLVGSGDLYNGALGLTFMLLHQNDMVRRAAFLNFWY